MKKNYYKPVSQLTPEELAKRRAYQREYHRAHYKPKVAKLSVPQAKPAEPKAKSQKTWKLVSEMTEEQRLKKNAYQRKWYYAHRDAERIRHAKYNARQKVKAAEKKVDSWKAVATNLVAKATAQAKSGSVSKEKLLEKVVNALVSAILSVE